LISPVSLPPITLVLGGARSGKSTYAERLINVGLTGLYIATAEIRDEEMAERVRIHRQRRGEIWMTVEEPLDLAQAMKAHTTPERPILVECLTIWLSNLMEAGRNAGEEIESLIRSLDALKGPVVFVSGQVGQGVIPDNKLARDFVDAAGGLHQSMALASDRVVLITAGLPTILKDVNL